ncbi:hypothetical protein B0H11DRAFT_1900856 [Mycena galericulata]|nr:hypothetical protein B0H11DRAFT_1900856 [Mycena galericulata]
MPVLTRRMRKDAGLPDLPVRLPVDVPHIVSTRPPPNNGAPPKRRPQSVARSTLPLPSPSVLSSPTRLEAPSTLTSPAPSQRSHSRAASSSSFSTASTATEFDDQLRGTGVHPGVRRLQRRSDERWMFMKDGEAVRMCIPSLPPLDAGPVHQGASLFNEWGRLEGRDTPTPTYVAESRGSTGGSRSRASSAGLVPSSEGMVRGTPVSSRTSIFAGPPEKELRRGSRRQAGLGGSQH